MSHPKKLDIRPEPPYDVGMEEKQPTKQTEQGESNMFVGKGKSSTPVEKAVIVNASVIPLSHKGAAGTALVSLEVDDLPAFCKAIGRKCGPKDKGAGVAVLTARALDILVKFGISPDDGKRYLGIPDEKSPAAIHWFRLAGDVVSPVPAGKPAPKKTERCCLDAAERRYLSQALRPYLRGNPRLTVRKDANAGKFLLIADLGPEGHELHRVMKFPPFRPDSGMYAGMEAGKAYSAHELGLR